MLELDLSAGDVAAGERELDIDGRLRPTTKDLPEGGIVRRSAPVQRQLTELALDLRANAIVQQSRIPAQRHGDTTEVRAVACTPTMTLDFSKIIQPNKEL